MRGSEAPYATVPDLKVGVLTQLLASRDWTCMQRKNLEDLLRYAFVLHNGYSTVHIRNPNRLE